MLVNSTEGPFFARLCFLFSLSASRHSEPIPLAVVLPYDGKVDRRIREQDWESFELFRVKEPLNAQPEIVFARSILRGGVLVPTGDEMEKERPKELYVFDLIDPDMFLRMREMWVSDFVAWMLLISAADCPHN